MPTGDVKKGVKQNLWVNGNRGSDSSVNSTPTHIKRQRVVLVNGTPAAPVTTPFHVATAHHRRGSGGESVSESTFKTTSTSISSAPSDEQVDILADLETISSIVGAGIEHTSLRDEIYCQILKQLSKNPCEASRYRGGFPIYHIHVVT